MFHVKRDPIEKAAPLIRRTGDKIVDVRIDNLQWQHRRERGRPAAGLPVDANFEAISAIANPDRALVAPVGDSAEQHKLFLSVPNKVCCRRAAEGFASSQIRQRLQHAGFAGGVITVDQVVAGIRV